ncbi:MAG: DUF4388 domain-containing protein [Planctomycetes bacterium]|nr:DUF4388 domain-containing protein [Planctomycetota bacterium]
MNSAATQVTVDLALVLRLMSQARASGVVTLAGDPGEAHIVLVGGAVLHATSTATPKLGEALVARGVVTKDVLEDALRHQRRKKVKQPLGTILLELGVVSRAVAESEIEMQIIRVLVDAFEWQGCTLRFEPAEVSARHILFPESCQLETLLARIARARHAASV